jgi:hypothetical protein
LSFGHKKHHEGGGRTCDVVDEYIPIFSGKGQGRIGGSGKI